MMPFVICTRGSPVTLHPFARAPAALAVAVSQIIAALPALADDRVLAENGAHVDVRDRYIATSGHAETAIIARTGGSVSAQNITIANFGQRFARSTRTACRQFGR